MFCLPLSTNITCSIYLNCTIKGIPVQCVKWWHTVTTLPVLLDDRSATAAVHKSFWHNYSTLNQILKRAVPQFLVILRNKDPKHHLQPKHEAGCYYWHVVIVWDRSAEGEKKKLFLINPLFKFPNPQLLSRVKFIKVYKYKRERSLAFGKSN